MLRIVTGDSSFTAYPLLFLCSLSFFAAFFTGWSKSRINHAGALFLLTLLLIYYGAQMIYYRIFGSMFSISMIGLGGDAITNFGWALRHTMLDSIWWILLFSLPVILYIAALIIKKPVFQSAGIPAHLLTLAAVAVTWLLAVAALGIGGSGRYTAYDTYFNPHTTTDTAVQRIGALPTSVIELLNSGSDSHAETSLTAPTESKPETFTPQPSIPSDPVDIVEEPMLPDTSPNIIEEIDFGHLATLTEDERIKALCEYFSEVEGSNRNEYTGLLEGYNLIYICAEAFSPAAIHPDVTPTLYMLANNGIVLENYYNSFINTTTNGEFAFMTGLWPDMSRVADEGRRSGSFSQSCDNYMPYGLGNILSTEGYSSYAFHNYYGSYYNRASSHSNLGYKCKFMGNGMTFTNDWPTSDLEMMHQSVDDFINEDHFNVYYMTFSGHGPYSFENRIAGNNISTAMELTGSTSKGEAEYYLAANLELEYAMQYLMQRLDEAGKAAKTLIVLTGDHYPYYMNRKTYDHLVGEPKNADFSYYKSTCVMWCGGLEENIHCDTYCCNVDILPTVLNLLGVKFDSRLLPGRDVFSDSEHTAMLYDRSFVTEYVLFEADRGEAYWQVDISQIGSSDLQEYLNYTTAMLENNYAMSLEIMDTDFYRFVWENSGLMPQEPDPDSTAAG